MSDKPLIYSAMASILKKVDCVSKDRKSQGNFSFSYRSIDDVLNELHAAFAEFGVFVMQQVISHDMERPASGKGVHHVMTIKYRFIATDGSEVESIVKGECFESSDKGVGKCMSYAYKYCLLQAFLIPTDDESKDPDRVSNYIPQQRQQNAPQRQQPQQPAQRPQPQPQRQPEAQQPAPAPQQPQEQETVPTDQVPDLEQIRTSISTALKARNDWKRLTGQDAGYWDAMAKQSTDHVRLNNMLTHFDKLARD